MYSSMIRPMLQGDRGDKSIRIWHGERKPDNRTVFRLKNLYSQQKCADTTQLPKGLKVMHLQLNCMAYKIQS